MSVEYRWEWLVDNWIRFGRPCFWPHLRLADNPSLQQWRKLRGWEEQVGSDLLQLEWISVGNEIVFASHGFGA